MYSKLEIRNKDGVKVILNYWKDKSVFTGKTNHDFFARIEDGEDVRNVYPQGLTEKQKQMSVKDYVDNGRCEFFKHVRPNHMFKMIIEAQ